MASSYTAVVTATREGRIGEAARRPPRTTEALGADAHRRCPFSKATRDNIPVAIEATVVA
ncbi:hypothetical protein [Actinoallomurus sp. CA-150999]|uniref:hypothetical protein n=1 Tax=Actinoallomurus sp. CA-150999 TaxID=3239887 RepID=UPI003D9009CA